MIHKESGRPIYQCVQCGQRYVNITVKGEKRSFEPVPYFFIAKSAKIALLNGERTLIFTTDGGVEIEGVKARDGIKGYLPHRCY